MCAALRGLIGKLKSMRVSDESRRVGNMVE